MVVIFPGVGRKAGVTAEETRARLVAAAAEVFAERGVDGTRVAEVARRAGVTTGAIYAHFGTKAELLSEAIRAHGSPELARLLAGDDVDVVAALRAAGHSLHHTERAQRALAAEAIATARRDPAMAKEIASGIATREAVLARALRRARAAGRVDATLDPAAIARLATLLALGSLTAGALGLDNPDDDGWAAVVDRVIDSMLLEGDR
jgi:AcrR family transcriptional regulator